MTSVSIVCTNYNKGDAVAEAIESFLLQVTNFPVEILVVDDASTDGSQDIIHYYCENYPDRITGIFKEKNEGSAKTWHDACKVALGDYIARCDADDYWIDPMKLQKQVDLLQATSDSKWSNTDFDILLPDGTLVQNVFAQNIMPFVDCFEDVLIKQASTMASTWVIDAELMREVNDTLEESNVDDLFDMQLELFKRTKLSFVADSTTVTRTDANSIASIDGIAKQKARIEDICDWQIAVIESEEWLDYKELCKRFACWNAEQALSRMDS